jgi:hypothetical protein
MFKSRVLHTFIFLLLIQVGFSQVNIEKQLNISFKSGEKVTYRAVYNWGFIWINAADVIFKVRDTIYNGKPSIHLKSVGWSLKQYDWFYKVRDRFESIVSDSLQPYWFERDSYEGGYKAYNRYDYNYKDKTLKIVSQTSERSYRQELLTLRPGAFDVLSAIYYCRSINFNSLNIDQKVPLTMIIDNEIFDLYIRYLGKERLTAHDGKVYQTIKFSVKLVEGTIFKGGEDLNVWVIDDQYRIPVLIEAKILIGSIKAVLVSTEGLR